MHLLGCDSEDGVRTTSCEEAADNVSTTVWVNSNIRFVHSFHPSHAVYSCSSADFEMPMYHPCAWSSRPSRPPYSPSIVSVPAVLRLPTVPWYREHSLAREVHLSPPVPRMTRFVTTSWPTEDLSLPRLIRRSRSRVEMMSKLGCWQWEG